MIIPIHVPYRRKPGAAHSLGATHVDIRDVAEDEAPVAVRRVGTEYHDADFRVFDGRLWQLNHPTDRKLPKAALQEQLRFEPDVPACRQKLFQTLFPHSDLAMGCGIEDMDVVDDAPGLAGSIQMQRIRASLDDFLVVDGVLHRASWGPLVNSNGEHNAHVHWMGFHADNAAHWMGIHRQEEISTAAFLQDCGSIESTELAPPPLNLASLRLEATGWLVLDASSRSRLDGLDNRLIEAIVDIRRQLVPDGIDPWNEFTRQLRTKLRIPADGRERPIRPGLVEPLNAVAGSEVDFGIEWFPSAIARSVARNAPGALAPELEGLIL